MIADYGATVERYPGSKSPSKVFRNLPEVETVWLSPMAFMDKVLVIISLEDISITSLNVITVHERLSAQVG